MIKIKVEGATLKVGAGTLLGLTRDQALVRFHRLERMDAEKGIYKTREPMEFKAGEILSIDPADVPKHLRANVVDLDAAKDGEAAPSLVAKPLKRRAKA